METEESKDIKKIFVYSAEEAKKNNCIGVKSRYRELVEKLSVVLPAILGLPIAFLLPLLLPIPYSISFRIMIILWIASIALGIYMYVRRINIYYSAEHTIYILDNNNCFWWVRLAYIPEIIAAPSVSGLHLFPKSTELIYSALATGHNIGVARSNQREEDEIDRLKTILPEYIERWEEAKKDSEAGIGNWTLDYKTLMWNGKAKIMRLDDLKLISDKSRYRVYSFKNCFGKKTKIFIAKAYPGLLEVLKNDKAIQLNDTFPKNPKIVSRDLNRFFYVFLTIIFLLVAWLVIKT